MNIFKKLFGRKNKRAKQEDECWYNNSHEKKRPRWNASWAQEGTYDSAQHDQAVTNQIAKRQH